MSAIRKLIETAREQSTYFPRHSYSRDVLVSEADAAEAELRGLGGTDQSANANLVRMAQRTADEFAERERADAELLDAWNEWTSFSGSEQWEDLRAALERWAAARGEE